MEVDLNIGFNDGPLTVYAHTGKYGIHAPDVAVTTTGNAGPRPFTGGWYTALGTPQIYSGSTYLGIPNPTTVSVAGPVVQGSAGVNVPHLWKEIEPNGLGDSNRFRGLSLIQQDLDVCAALSKILGYNLQYILKFVNKNFTATNPLPADLATPAGQPGAITGAGPNGFASPITQGGPGFCSWRWHNEIVTRQLQVITKICTTFDGHPNFAGIAFPETATSYTVNSAVDGYSDSGYIAGLNAESASVFQNSTALRPYPYINFWPTGTNDQGTINLATVAQGNQAFAAIMGFPDLCTPLAPGLIPHRVYDIIIAYATAGAVSRQLKPVPAPPTVIQMSKLCGTFGSVQRAEWTGDGPPKLSPPADPTPVSLPNLYNMATSSFTFQPNGTFNDPNQYARDHRSDSGLLLPMWMVDWHTDDTANMTLPQTFNPVASRMILSNPQLAAWNPI